MIRGLAINVNDDKVSLYYKLPGEVSAAKIAESDDGINFQKTKLILKTPRAEKILNFKISQLDNKEVYCLEEKTPKGTQTFLGTKKLPPSLSTGYVVSNYKYKGSHVAYFGGDQITVAVFKTLSKINFSQTPIKGGSKVSVDFVTKTNQGIFVIYHYYDLIRFRDPYLPTDDLHHLIIKAVCFDPEDPAQVIWESKNSIWPEPESWKGKKADCLGMISFKGNLISYWNVEDLGMALINFPIFMDHPAHEHHHYKLIKHPDNPILSPNHKNTWENEATFNPAVFYEDGKVYLLYRALGHGFLSVLGLAESKDGLNFKRSHSAPVYMAREDFEKKSPKATKKTFQRFTSGGGFAGCEDPRITKLDDKLYMIYVAFNGWEGPRLALTSIAYEDFKKANFLWEKPVLISPPGVTDKSGCILPEKINGKYVIFHRIFPNILIDYVDDLDFNGSTWLKGEFKITPRPTMWDSRKVGAGAPPIKTRDGWLLIYQAVTDNDDSKYKVGAMLLDLNDPTKVLHRTNHPLIEPDQFYENNLAKFGVVYPCGAVIIDGKLFVYYGASDSVTCVATANLNDFLHELTSYNEAKLTLPND